MTRFTAIPCVVSAAALLALAGCSSSGASNAPSSGGGSPSGASAPAAGSVTVASASALLKQASTSAITGPSMGIVPTSQIVPWTQSLMPTPSALPTGKSVKVDVVFHIPTGFAPYSAHVIQAIGKKLGWQVKVFQAAQPTQQAALAAYQQAVLDKPTAIISSVVPGVWLGPALAKAKSEGIHTVDMHQDSTTGSGYDAWVPDGEGIQKALLGAYAVSHSGGKANSLLLDAPGFSDANIPAVKSYLAGCSGCTTNSAQFNAPDFTDPVAAEKDVTAKLASVSGLNYMFWPDGALPIQTVVNAIGSSRDHDAKLLVNDAAPSSVQPLKAGQLPLVVESPAALMPLIAIDDVSRMVQGQAPLAQTALRFPVSYWTPQNAPDPTYQAITAAQLKQADWLTPFEKAWKVDLSATLAGVAS